MTDQPSSGPFPGDVEDAGLPDIDITVAHNGRVPHYAAVGIKAGSER
jgi:hypothetical protein